MSRRISVVVLLLVVATVAPFGVGTAVAADGGCTFPFSKTDATGTTVTVAESPDRIVTLSPSAAQTVFEISASDDPAWDRVVGVSPFASFLPDADEKTNVGSTFSDSDAVVEKTIALSPDLVLIPNSVNSPVHSDLRDAGLTVYKFRESEDLDDIVEKTRLTGKLVGECDGAADTADSMENDLDLIEDALRDEPEPKGIYYFFGFTAGQGTFVNEVITTAGVDHIGDTGSSYYVISAETIAIENPEWFFVSSDQYSTASVPEGPNGAFTETTAYKEGNAVLLDANEVSQPAPRIVDAIVDIVQVVHPEAYREEIRGRLDSSAELDGEKRILSRELADGTLRLEAQNIGRDSRVSFELPAQAADPVALQRLNVSLKNVNPTFTVDLVPLRAGEGPASLEGTNELRRFTTTPNGLSDDDVRRVRLRFAVNESALAATNASAENVTLYHRAQGSWQPLQTTVVGTQNGSVLFEAASPSLSTFAIGVPETETAQAVTATPTPEPTPEPTASPSPPSSPTRTETAVSPSTPTATTSTEFPGFGVSAAIVALLAMLTVARVRRE